PVRGWLPRAPGSRVAIVPHGPLFPLSFAALTDERGRYLLERHALFYAPSVATLETGSPAGEPRATHYLLVADPGGMPRDPEGRALAALPGSRREVAAIARLLPAADVTTLVGAAARADAVRAGLRDATVIHFATHGIVNDGDPLESFLAI